MISYQNCYSKRWSIWTIGYKLTIDEAGSFEEEYVKPYIRALKFCHCAKYDLPYTYDCHKKATTTKMWQPLSLPQCRHNSDLLYTCSCGILVMLQSWSLFSSKYNPLHKCRAVHKLGLETLCFSVMHCLSIYRYMY